MRSHIALSVAAIVGIFACSDATSPTGTVSLASKGFLNATPGKVDVAVDNVTMLSGVDGSVIARKAHDCRRG